MHLGNNKKIIFVFLCGLYSHNILAEGGNGKTCFDHVNTIISQNSVKGPMIRVISRLTTKETIKACDKNKVCEKENEIEDK